MSFKDRTEIIFGKKGMELLQNSTVAVYGLGGVGASAALSLVRAGVGTIAVTDFDKIETSNLNRLAFGFESTVNLDKTEVFVKTALDINREISIISSKYFIHGEDAPQKLHNANFHIDAIDTLNSKVNLIIALLEKGEKFISSMGTGGKTKPELLQIADIWKTEMCPLSKLVRKRLKSRGIKGHFPVVFSKETQVPPVERSDESFNSERMRKIQGSTPFVPQAAGLILASYAVRTILEDSLIF
ncbi:MAG: tRNA threonylcarbamoyladenosine dehydratase [bacterium]